MSPEQEAQKRIAEIGYAEFERRFFAANRREAEVTRERDEARAALEHVRCILKTELNPNNYTEDQVFKLNEESIEACLYIDATLSIPVPAPQQPDAQIERMRAVCHAARTLDKILPAINGRFWAAAKDLQVSLAALDGGRSTVASSQPAPAPRTERSHSEFHLPCECGKSIVTRLVETTCPACGRILIIEWGGKGAGARQPGGNA